MPTLLMQCVAPLQSWGTQSNFSVRDTGREPSKSGIIGLLCAALGRPRTVPLDDLSALAMGIRVDREGQILRDFHTAGQGGKRKGFLKADGKGIDSGTIVSNRYYLTDAMFLVGLSGNVQLLQTIQGALANPRWMLFLGRKACPPARPVYLPDGLRHKPLLEALIEYPWLGKDPNEHARLTSLRLVLEAGTIQGEESPNIKQETPLSFVKGTRRFAQRRSQTIFLNELPAFRAPFCRTEEDL
ncbi:MAG: type I-E CRISPR-associated protein Cas5/CasD [Caldilineaceae bacterium]|nr:type I-E CRISPR-associated protein Cas5/CasD [Caldilineaceae bacterium]